MQRAFASARKIKFLLFGLIALAVLAGGSLYLARGGPSGGPPGSGSAAAAAAAGQSATTAGCGTAGPASTGGTGGTASCMGTAADVAVAGPPAVVTVPPVKAGTARPSGTLAASPSASAGSASPRPTMAAPGMTSMTAPAPGSGPASPAPGGSSGTQDSSAAAQVLALINQARSAAGLPALTVTSGLDASSSAHNLKMAAGCGLSHQCPGEAAIGNRETAAGVVWTAAGENIGEGGPVSDTSAAIAQMAVGLTQSMLDEQPPNDGHRMNILSSTFTHIGIAVYRDSSGTVWLTQDFSN
ncbi:MAG TPA: CAP domain-containing protein [Trebonia sp.]|nr:CAP domain-containing protein [Trebonia sp.]